ncbi:MAG TPA: hypothetical protein VMH80_14450 [Bryobacteraceae bacterium]|nr:hypothetical protein [Bryobacteraceae bacterium]
MSARKIVLLEFNELCPSLLQKWIGEGKLPNFQAFYNESEVYITEADEKTPPHLEPWVQWYSIHTGLSFKQHGVAHLTDGPRAGHPDIWSILLGSGKSVANCSSMNARGFSAPGSFFLPDPWCLSEEPSPSELHIFHRVVARMVQEYTNDSPALSIQDYSRFFLFLASHGLRLKTVSAIAKQMILDQFIDKEERWRRAVLLDKLQFDVFRHYYRKLKLDFATFFLNSTAHYQHSYWRHMDPTPFTVRPSNEKQRRYGRAILFGYEQMDKLLGDFLRLAGGDTILILATALSQQPFLRAEASGGQYFYRPHDIDALLGSLAIRPQSVRPVMTHQYLLSFADEGAAAEARRKLGSISFQGDAVLEIAPSEPGTVYMGCQLHSMIPADALVMVDGRQARFYDLFYPLGEIKSGCHHPDGVFWVRSGQHRVHTEKLSILEILPMLLRHYGVGHTQNAVRASEQCAVAP